MKLIISSLIVILLIGVAMLSIYVTLAPTVGNGGNHSKTFSPFSPFSSTKRKATMNRIVYHVNQNKTEFYVPTDKHGYVQISIEDARQWHSYEYFEFKHNKPLVNGRYGFQVLNG